MNVNGISPAMIAAALEMNESQAWRFARRVEHFYKPARLQRVGKKQRVIDAPSNIGKKRLKLLHRWFQQRRLYHPSAHGGIQRRSCFTAAARHLGRTYVWTRDASDCYPSVAPQMFRAELLALGFRADTALLLTMLCTVRGRIPQGSPVSGDALNLFFWRLDQVLSSSCGKKLSYTRSADDAVVSGNNPQQGDNAARLIERELAARGIGVNEKKRAENGCQSNFQHQHVHSIRVNNRRGTTISNKHRDESLAMANAFVAACKSLQLDSLEAVAYKRRRLQGWVNYCGQATFSHQRHLCRLLDAGDRIVRRKLLKLGLSSRGGKWWLVHSRSHRNEPRRLVIAWRKKVSAIAT